MGDIFEGKTDVRQTDAAELDPAHSLFRKRYRALTPEEIALHDKIKDKADELAALFCQVGAIRDKVIGFVDWSKPATIKRSPAYDVVEGIAHLEDAVYRVVKSLTS